MIGYTDNKTVQFLSAERLVNASKSSWDKGMLVKMRMAMWKYSSDRPMAISHHFLSFHLLSSIFESGDIS